MAAQRLSVRPLRDLRTKLRLLWQIVIPLRPHGASTTRRPQYEIPSTEGRTHRPPDTSMRAVTMARTAASGITHAAPLTGVAVDTCRFNQRTRRLCACTASAPTPGTTIVTSRGCGKCHLRRATRCAKASANAPSWTPTTTSGQCVSSMRITAFELLRAVMVPLSGLPFRGSSPSGGDRAPAPGRP